MIQYLGYFGGYAYCLYCIVFRWRFLRDKFGSIDLIFWLGAVVWVFALAAFLLEFALWYVTPDLWTLYDESGWSLAK